MRFAELRIPDGSAPLAVLGVVPPLQLQQLAPDDEADEGPYLAYVFMPPVRWSRRVFLRPRAPAPVANRERMCCRLSVSLCLSLSLVTSVLAGLVHKSSTGGVRLCVYTCRASTRVHPVPCPNSEQTHTLTHTHTHTRVRPPPPFPRPLSFSLSFLLCCAFLLEGRETCACVCVCPLSHPADVACHGSSTCMIGPPWI